MSTLEIPIPERSEPIRVNRYVISKGDERQLVIYWYQTPRRVVANEFTAKFYTIIDGLRYHRSDTSLIRVIVPIGADEDVAQRSALDFIRSSFHRIRSSCRLSSSGTLTLRPIHHRPHPADVRLVLWRLWRRRPHALRWLIPSWILLLLLSWEPFSVLLIGTLEWQTPRFNAPPQGEQAIVVLSGGLYTPDPPRPEVIANMHTYVRCRHAAWLYQHGWRVPVVLTGGNTPGGHSLAGVMAGIMTAEGVAPEHVWQEAGSESTYEYALFAARLLQPLVIRRILLVTEAFNMPRARLNFRKAGFDVVASPAFIRLRSSQVHGSNWILPMPQSMVRCEDAIHEWIGLISYRLRGRL